MPYLAEFPLLLFVCVQAHCVKATALMAAGLKEEALQEYLLCVALWPEWNSVKREAQKVNAHAVPYSVPYSVSLSVAHFVFLCLCLPLSLRLSSQGTTLL